MKRKFLFLSVACSVLAALLVLATAWLVPRYQVPILMYHAITPSWHEPLNNVMPANFARQMNYISSHGYRVMTLDELVEGIRTGRRVFQRSVVITFDDGYENNYTRAYPYLKQHDFPAAIFLEVANVDHPGYLTWAQAVDMAAHGVTFGSHMMTGAYIPGLPREEAVSQIRESKRLIEARLGRPALFFAYPIGGFDETVKQALRDAGYAAAFATNRGNDHKGMDLYELKRIRVKDGDSALVLWFKLSGYYNFFRPVKSSN